MQNVRNVKLPDPRLISGIVQTAVFGGAGAYGLYHSLFNVEGGHRAIVYNRFVGIREKVRPRRPATTSAMTSTSARPRIRAPPIVANGSSASIARFDDARDARRDAISPRPPLGFRAIFPRRRQRDPPGRRRVQAGGPRSHPRTGSSTT